MTALVTTAPEVGIPIACEAIEIPFNPEQAVGLKGGAGKLLA
jgi:hypothetical protein